MPARRIFQQLFCVKLKTKFAFYDGSSYACNKYECAILSADTLLEYHAIHVYQDILRLHCHSCLAEIFEIKPINTCNSCLIAYLEETGPFVDDPIILREKTIVQL